MADLATGLEDGGDILAERHLGLMGSAVGRGLLRRGGRGGHQRQDDQRQGGRGIRRTVRADKQGTHEQILV